MPPPQPEADAIWDWQNVARQIAFDMAERGLLPGPPAAPGGIQNPPYYVNVTGPYSAFLHEARESLQSEILRRGGTVYDSPNGAVTINLTSDLVYWPSAYTHHDGASASEVAWEASIVSGKSEVAWEASIVSGDRVVFDVRYPIYVSTLDTALYDPPPPPPAGPPTIQLRYAR